MNADLGHEGGPTSHYDDPAFAGYSVVGGAGTWRTTTASGPQPGSPSKQNWSTPPAVRHRTAPSTSKRLTVICALRRQPISTGQRRFSEKTPLLNFAPARLGSRARRHRGVPVGCGPARTRACPEWARPHPSLVSNIDPAYGVGVGCSWSGRRFEGSILSKSGFRFCNCSLGNKDHVAAGTAPPSRWSVNGEILL